MELRQLRHFVAVAEEQSFTRAAAKAHVVQSGLSATVAALERELGVRLFDRTTRRIVLTEPGHHLLTQARDILDAVDRAQDSVASVAGGLRGTLKVGIMHSLLPPPVALALADFHRERPHVRLVPSTHRDGSAGLIRAVTDNDLDLAFAAVLPHQSTDVHTRTISSEQMVLVCPPGHRLARQPKVALTALAEESFVDVPTGWGSRSSTDQLFTEHSVPRRVEVEVGDVATVLDLVRVGLGVALIAASSAPALDGLAVVEPDPAPTFQVSLVLPHNRPVKPAAQILADLVLASDGRHIRV